VSATTCAPLKGVAVDVWHCDAAGVYSGYSGQLGGADTRGQTFLRGTQLTGDDGRVRFDTIYPGWYPGRTTHVYRDHRSAPVEATRPGARAALADLAGDARTPPAVGDECASSGVRRGEPRPVASDEGTLLYEMGEERVDESRREPCFFGDDAAVVRCDLDEPGAVDQSCQRMGVLLLPQPRWRGAL
jgi:hypothetical protein